MTPRRVHGAHQRSGSWSYLAPFIGYILLTVIFTWPLVLRMKDSVVGQIGDNVYFVWLFGWFDKALFTLHRSPFVVPQLNYPEGWSLAHTEIVPSVLALGLPFSRMLGPVFAYNFALLLTFVLSGFFTFLWAKDLTGDPWAALFAGTAFAFVPYRVAHFLSGHLNLASTMWFPLFFWGFVGWLSDREVRRKYLLLTGIGLGLIALTSMYYLYMTGIVSAIGGLLFLLVRDRRRLLSRRFWYQAAIVALCAAPLVLLGVLPFVQLESQGGLASRDVQSVTSGSASLSDFLLPSTDHFLWGSWVSAHFARDHWMEGTLYIGVVVAGLATLAFLRRRGLSENQRDAVLLLGFLALTGLALALGTYFHWNEQPVSLILPKTLQGLLHREHISLRMPGYYLFQYVPFYSRMRVFKRFAVFVLLATSVAGGIGLGWARRRIGSRWADALTILLLAAMLFEFFPGQFREFARIAPRPVDVWLAAQPGQGAVAQFPFSQEADQIQIYYTLAHGKPYLGGFFNAFPPRQFKRIAPVMAGFPDAASVGLLRQLGVVYVLVDRGATPDIEAVRAGMTYEGLEYQTTQGDQMVFTLAK